MPDGFRRKMVPMPLGLASHRRALRSNARGATPSPRPSASVHYAPDRTCDLQHVSITLDVDYPNRTFAGRAVNTLSPLRSRPHRDHAERRADHARSRSVTVNGAVGDDAARRTQALRRRAADRARGKQLMVAIDYKGENSKAAPLRRRGGGFHWIEPRNERTRHPRGLLDPGRGGVQQRLGADLGLPERLRHLRRDATPSPTDWTAIGNGRLVSETQERGRQDEDLRLEAGQAPRDLPPDRRRRAVRHQEGRLARRAPLVRRAQGPGQVHRRLVRRHAGHADVLLDALRLRVPVGEVRAERDVRLRRRHGERLRHHPGRGFADRGARRLPQTWRA